MYLGQLSNEKKELFLDLSIHVALSNNDLAAEEKATIDAYCDEMGLPASDYVAKKDLQEVLEELKMKCTNTEKNIILIEIVGLMMSDSIYDTMEEKFMKDVQAALGISDEKVEKAILAVRQLMQAYKMLNEIIVE